MNNFLNDAFEIIIFIIVLSILIGGPILFFGNWITKKSCTEYGQITGKNINYRFVSGCFVETESGWLTKSEYGQTIIAKEGLMSINK